MPSCKSCKSCQESPYLGIPTGAPERLTRRNPQWYNTGAGMGEIRALLCLGGDSQAEQQLTVHNCRLARKGKWRA